MESIHKTPLYIHVDIFDLFLHQYIDSTDQVAKHENNSFLLLNKIQINKTPVK